jgi:hypothetical protein
LQTKPKKTPPRAAGRAPRAAASRRPATPVALAALAAVAALVLLYLLELHWGAPNLGAGETAATNAVAAVAPVGAVRVTEVMSSNKTAVPDEAGKYPDWVELFNAAQEPVDITGWSLTDNMDKLVRFTFPEMTLAPGEYVVVYCDDDLKNTAGYPFTRPSSSAPRATRCCCLTGRATSCTR